jgi:hypothetical protein
MEAFEKRVEHFLSAHKITGINAEVEDLDRMLIAAAAIIPVYRIPDWQYINLHEVLLYPGTFNADFEQGGSDRNIIGMVGTGALQHMMVISKWQLRQGFINPHDARNTAIHEFVHLIDKMDSTLAARRHAETPAYVTADRKNTRRFFAQYENPFEPLIFGIYENYLKANNQPMGHKSYNYVVAWLIAFAKKYGWESL